VHSPFLLAIALTTLMLNIGCAATSPNARHAGELTVETCIAQRASEHSELEAINARLRSHIREMDGQLAVARTDLRALRRANQRRATMRIGAEDTAPRQVPAEESAAVASAEEGPEEPRIVLRLYGTRPDAPSAESPRGPLPPLVLPPRPANIPGTLTVTGPRRADAPPPVAIPIAPAIPMEPSAEPPHSATPELAAAEYRDALALLRGRRLNEALARLRRFTQTYPRHAYADNALFWQGEVLYMQRQYREALDAFSGVVNRYPSGNKVPDALLKMARCHQRLGNARQARALLSRVQSQYPNSVAAQVALREDTT